MFFNIAFIFMPEFNSYKDSLIMRDQPGEEVKSLVGKIDVSAMGQSIARDKPKKAKKKAASVSEPSFKSGNILD